MALTLKVTNNASGSLNAGINDSVLELTLKADEGLEFPSTASSGYFYVTIQADSGAWEIVKVTDKTGDVFTIERNEDSSTGSAQAFSGDDIVSLRPCQGIIDDIIAEITAHEIQLYAPVGTKMFFYQAAAPTGWTTDAAVADAVIALKGGSDDYDDTAGTLVGEWLPVHAHGMNSHTHTVTEDTTTHTHGVSGTTNNDTSSLKDQGSGSNDCTPRHSHVFSTTSDADGGNHDHGGVTGAAAGNTENNADTTTWRPYAALSIQATKD